MVCSSFADCKEMTLLLPCLEQGETCKNMMKILGALVDETFKCTCNLYICIHHMVIRHRIWFRWFIRMGATFRTV